LSVYILIVFSSGSPRKAAGPVTESTVPILTVFWADAGVANAKARSTAPASVLRDSMFSSLV
jgi:hypothetical protein